MRTTSAASATGVASALLCSLLMAMPGGDARAAEVKILCPIGLRPAMVELIPQFEQASGHRLTVDYATVAALATRINKGEPADIVIVTRQHIGNLSSQGRIAAGSAVDIARQGVGLFVRKGAPKPDIGSVEAFKRTLLAAKSIAHADPAGGGGTAVYVAGLLGRMDIAREIQPKIRLFAPGVYDSVAKGEVEIGIGGTSEILADASVDLVGPLPAALQDYTQFSAGILASSAAQEAARSFLGFISSASGAALFKAKGYEPDDPVAGRSSR